MCFLIRISGALLILWVSFVDAQAQMTDDLLKAYHIEGIPGGVELRQFHEDARGKYYYGTVKWQDPKWDSDYKVTRIFAFMKVQDEAASFMRGKISNANLHNRVQPLFRVATSEIKYFNDVLLPALKTSFPVFRLPSPPEGRDIQVSSYVLGVHLEDSRSFFRSRADHKIIPEQPLFEMTWRVKGAGQYMPYYEIAGWNGHPVETFSGERKIWNNLVDARADRSGIGSTTVDVTGAYRSIPQLFRDYMDRKRSREEAAKSARREAVIVYLNKKAMSGAVYRNSSFWDQIDHAQTMRTIFDGEFSRIDDPLEAAAVYVGYVTAFDDLCHAYLPPTPAWHMTQPYVSENNGPWRKDGPPTKVYMDPLFLPKYEQMLNWAKKGETIGALASFFGVFFGHEDMAPAELLRSITQPLAEMFRRKATLRSFLNAAGCSSATARQLGEHLILFANGRAVPKRSNGSASAESEPVTEADIQRELSLRLQKHAQDILRHATNPVKGEDGWLIASEELQPYKIIKYGNEERYRTPGLYRKTVDALQSKKQPVLVCRYGPTGVNGELPTWRFWIFWYYQKPNETAELLKVDRETHPGLEFAVEACPQTTGAVQRLIN